MVVDEKKEVGNEESRDAKHVDLHGAPKGKIELYRMLGKKDEEWGRNQNRNLLRMVDMPPPNPSDHVSPRLPRPKQLGSSTSWALRKTLT